MGLQERGWAECGEIDQHVLLDIDHRTIGVVDVMAYLKVPFKGEAEVAQADKGDGHSSV